MYLFIRASSQPDMLTAEVCNADGFIVESIRLTFNTLFVALSKMETMRKAKGKRPLEVRFSNDLQGAV